MRDSITKKYSNGEITVIWKPELCTHSARCWKGLGSVFNPQARPWVNVEGADSARIMAQVDQCPSGALSYLHNDGAEVQTTTSTSLPTIEVTPDGPLEITGDVVIINCDGARETRSGKMSLCRCGQSGNKPFCDGSHETSGFKG